MGIHIMLISKGFFRLRPLQGPSTELLVPQEALEAAERRRARAEAELARMKASQRPNTPECRKKMHCGVIYI
jgi:hypothetical protein